MVSCSCEGNASKTPFPEKYVDIFVSSCTLCWFCSCCEQVVILLLEILTEADIRPAAKSSTPKEGIVRSPRVVAPAHDGGLPSMADFAAIKAALEELQADKDKQQEELKAMRSANEDLQRKVIRVVTVEH
ncbi:unnamed protein product [Ectocarpus fasciculatus]